MDWWGAFLIDILPFGLLGVLFGRFWFAVIPLPIVFWFGWLYLNGPLSPEDDVSGPATLVLTVIGVAAAIGGVVLHYGFRRGLLRREN
jgi:hypothetical protein